MSGKKLILVMGDHLTPGLLDQCGADPSKDVILMCEVRSAAMRVPYHKKKLVFLFSAMRHYRDELRALGWNVDYVELTDSNNTGTLTGEAARALNRHETDHIVAVSPSSWSVQKALTDWARECGVRLTLVDDTRFLCSTDEFRGWTEGRKQLRMEYFYRDMRKKHGLLMAGGKPIGGKWNFDAENRKRPPADLKMPSRGTVTPNPIVEDVSLMVEEGFGDHFGTTERFDYAVTRKDAEQIADRFFQVGLSHFGDYQDAMLTDEPFLFHSVLSLYLNIGLLDPLDLCRRAEEAYQEGVAPLNSVEGFIRQILGWREYVRGIYWLKMPDYEHENYFGNKRGLPDFYWTGETDMACVRSTVEQTRDFGYAHHIQRLMVTGTFALIAGIDPRDVHEWYLAVYLDAYEWVEMPNTIGMSQFADGGLLGSKPYAASGAYINRMSNYCKGCQYSVKDKTGDKSCPFNALYWDFLVRNEAKLKSNPRLGNVYRTWERMKPDTQKAYRKRARTILKSLDSPSGSL